MIQEFFVQNMIAAKVRQREVLDAEIGVLQELLASAKSVKSELPARTEKPIKAKRTRTVMSTGLTNADRIKNVLYAHNGPMGVTDIVERIAIQLDKPSKDIRATFASSISKNLGKMFIRVSEGVYGLKDRDEANQTSLDDSSEDSSYKI